MGGVRLRAVLRGAQEDRLRQADQRGGFDAGLPDRRAARDRLIATRIPVVSGPRSEDAGLVLFHLVEPLLSRWNVGAAAVVLPRGTPVGRLDRLQQRQAR